MDLSARLAGLQAQAGGCGSETPAGDACGLQARLTRLARSQRRKPDQSHRRPPPDDLLAGRVKGELIEPGVILIDRRIPLSDGPDMLADIDPQLITPLPGEPDGAGRCLYIDTETTGLSGGSGTIAFLIGIASVEPDVIVMKQFLLTRFSSEAALLAAFVEHLSGDDKLVSYNGKSYDLPLLRSRFRMQGMAYPFASTQAHLDLLHPTRRLFATAWPDCRLLTLERELLGFRRLNDLPGAEAPAAWFGYLRHGRVERLRQVVAHNQQDILSLAAAHAALCSAVAQPHLYHVDIHALARWLAKSDEPRASALLSAQADNCCDNGKRLQAHLARRAGNWSLAVGIWNGLSAGGCAESTEQLAKYHEHVSNDLNEAIRCCRLLPVTPAQQHRLRRLKRRALLRGSPALLTAIDSGERIFAPPSCRV